jgi:hypothetical protein
VPDFKQNEAREAFLTLALKLIKVRKDDSLSTDSNFYWGNRYFGGAGTERANPRIECKEHHPGR